MKAHLRISVKGNSRNENLKIQVRRGHLKRLIAFRQDPLHQPFPLTRVGHQIIHGLMVATKFALGFAKNISSQHAHQNNGFRICALDDNPFRPRNVLTCHNSPLPPFAMRRFPSLFDFSHIFCSVKAYSFNRLNFVKRRTRVEMFNLSTAHRLVPVA